MKKYIDVAKVRMKFPEYVTEKQMMEMMGLSKRSVYLIIKSGAIEYESCIDGKLHYYRIHREDVIRLIEMRQKIISDSARYIIIHQFLTGKYQTVRDVLLTQEASCICGISVMQLQRLIGDGTIKAVQIKQIYHIPKRELIRYMASESYLTSRSDSPTRKKVITEINAFLEKERRKDSIDE